MKVRRALTILVAMIALFSTLLAVQTTKVEPEKIIIVPKPSEFTVDLWFNKEEGATYKPGEEITIFVKPSQSAYIYVFDITPDGKVRLLFPNKYESHNFVSANTVKRIPAQGSKYTLKVGGAPGKEIVEVIAVKSKFRFIPFPFVESFPILSKEPLKFFTDVVRKQLVGEWTSASSYFYVGIVPTHGTVSFESDPSGAHVYVDGRYRGTTPMKLVLDSGDHFAVFYLDGYEPVTLSFQVKPNQVVVVNAKFIKPSHAGRVKIDSDPQGAKVYIDGIYRGTTPLDLELPEGKHDLRVVHPDYVEEYAFTFQIFEGSNVVYAFPFHQKRERFGTLEIRSQPAGAKVFLNGKYYGDTPVTLRLHVGSYELALIEEGYHVYVKNVTVEEGVYRVVTVDLVKIE